MSDQNVATTRRIFDEAWSEGDLEVIDELLSPEYVDHDPVMGEGNRESVKEAIESYRAAFPDLELELHDCFAAGDRVVCRWSALGTFENEFMGQEPTGERVAPVDGISIDRFDEEGRVIEGWAQWDVVRFMRNIGAIPDEVASANAV